MANQTVTQKQDTINKLVSLKSDINKIIGTVLDCNNLGFDTLNELQDWGNKIHDVLNNINVNLVNVSMQSGG